MAATTCWREKKVSANKSQMHEANCGVVLASVLYVEAGYYYSKRERDASGYTIIFSSYCEPGDDGDIGAYINWTYGMTLLALLFQITVVILLGFVEFCIFVVRSF